MKITSVDLVPAGSASTCFLSFRDLTRTNPYNVKQIVGLDADEILPGSHVLEKRDIVILISLNPEASGNQSYSDLRDELYRLIASSRTGVIQLRFNNGDDVVATVSGSLTKVEAAHFAKEPDVQVTLTCSDPMLRAPVPTSLNVAGLDPALTIITDALSTAPHGFKFELEFGFTLVSLVMTDPDDDSWSFTVTPLGGFLTGDVLHFSSEHNNKYLYIQRAGNPIHVGEAIVSGSAWPLIFPGQNKYSIASAANLDWLAIEHRPTYWGV